MELIIFYIGEGKSAKINVKEGDNYYSLATNFANEHKLGQEALSKVFNLISATASQLPILGKGMIASALKHKKNPRSFI